MSLASYQTLKSCFRSRYQRLEALLCLGTKKTIKRNSPQTKQMSALSEPQIKALGHGAPGRIFICLHFQDVCLQLQMLWRVLAAVRLLRDDPCSARDTVRFSFSPFVPASLQAARCSSSAHFGISVHIRNGLLPESHAELEEPIRLR